MEEMSRAWALPLTALGSSMCPIVLAFTMPLCPTLTADRTGTHFWGFETQGVIPDIVTMAKGIGNGCPLAAVVTTPQIASVLSKRIHFNTFGGNPVVCAMGKAVLEVIEREKLQENSLKLGNHILAGLEKLKTKHKLIGDVRGKGLMLGIELVKDRNTKEAAKAECAQVLELCREMGLL